ncbi:MAG: hypothetical protein HFF99_03150 [Oscillibacter sp.]|nr:hypothetical protein [Oscillibacter sp.]
MSKLSKQAQKREKQREKKNFRQAMEKELREHKSSFLVFYTLRLLVIVIFVRQIIIGGYESAFYCALAYLLLYVPSWIQVKFHIELPPALEITVLCFIYALNGFLAAAVGFAMVVLLNDDERLTFDLSPVFLALVAFCFSMTIGVLWEFFEFGMDMFFHTDMQRDTVVNAIYSASLDVTRSNKVVAVPGIQEVLVNGESLGLGGYLDIGLIDTMKDLFVNFIGAVVFSFTGFFYAKSKGRKRTAAQGFVPSRKTADRDYLNQAREENGDKPEP